MFGLRKIACLHPLRCSASTVLNKYGLANAPQRLDIIITHRHFKRIQSVPRLRSHRSLNSISNCFGHPLVEFIDYELLIDRHFSPSLYICHAWLRSHQKKEEKSIYKIQPLDIFPDPIRNVHIYVCMNYGIELGWSWRAGSTIKITLCDLHLHYNANCIHLINGP